MVLELPQVNSQGHDFLFELWGAVEGEVRKGPQHYVPHAPMAFPGDHSSILFGHLGIFAGVASCL
jgi:hypothetical protein